MAVKCIPEGYHTITPYLMVKGAVELMDFLKTSFDAVEMAKTEKSDGTIMNAALKIGDSMVLIAEVHGDYQPTPTSLYLYVPDTDDFYHRAIKAGATSLMEPANQFYGDRNAGVQDPSGTQWWIATRIENLSEEEIQQRANELVN